MLNKSGRVVVLGSNSFIAKNFIKLLKNNGIPNLGLTRAECDFENPESINILSNIIDDNDTIIFIAANAPVKNNEMFLSNIKISNNICASLSNKKFKHLIYISSDAVYYDAKGLLNEMSFCQPASLHGSMHYSREVMIQSVIKSPICIIRPTLIYGINDPHNGYGPNSFFRKALKNEDILLFGEGEERRDHIYIEDVAEYILYSILEYKEGIFNIASGKVISFKEIAECIVDLTKSKSNIITSPRIGKMPHNGYRAFDINKINDSYPKIKPKDLKSGINFMINKNRNS